MSAAAYNRGSRVLAREADTRMSAAVARSERQAHKEESERLRERVARLERDLSRARRCLAAERNGREQLRHRLAATESAYQFCAATLCRIAFPGDVP